MAVTMNESGIPIGSYWGTKGPNRYEFLIEGLHQRSERSGAQEFMIEGVKVDIKVVSVKQVPHWDCPELPDGLRSRIGAAHDWSDAWEFWGYVPGYAVGIRAVYSTTSRVGRYDLWEQSTQSYGCDEAQEDLRSFVSNSRRDGYPEAALRRAIKHMTEGTGIIGGLNVRCEKCWEQYARMRTAWTRR